MPESHSSAAIVLRTRPYGEVDIIATFLTDDVGKLTGIAKGAKHSRRRFPNCLEVFARVRLYFRTRAGASLAFLERCDLLHPASAMGLPSRLAYGGYLVELVDQLTHEGQPLTEVYALLAAALDAVETGPATSVLLRTFELQLLRDLGYSPQLEACGRCQRPFAETAHALFDPQRGELVCNRCGTAAPGDRFAPDTLAELARLQVTPLPASQTMHLPADAVRQAATLTGNLLAAHLPRPLRSLQLIAALGGG